MKKLSKNSVLKGLVLVALATPACLLADTTYYCVKTLADNKSSPFLTPSCWTTSGAASGTACSSFDGTGKFVVTGGCRARVNAADTFNVGSLLVSGTGAILFYSAGKSLTVGGGSTTVTLDRGSIWNDRQKNDSYADLLAKLHVQSTSGHPSSLFRANSYASSYDGVRCRLRLHNQVSADENATLYVGYDPSRSGSVSTKGHTFDVEFQDTTAAFYGKMIVTSRVANVTYPTYGNCVKFLKTTDFPGAMSYSTNTVLYVAADQTLTVGTLSMSGGSSLWAASNATVKVTGTASFSGKVNVRLAYTHSAVASKRVYTILEAPTALDLDDFVLDRRTLTNFNEDSAKLVLSEDGKKLQVVLYPSYYMQSSYSDSSTYHAAWGTLAAWKNAAGANPTAIDDDGVFVLAGASWLRFQTDTTTFNGHSLTIGDSSGGQGFLWNYDVGNLLTFTESGELVFYYGFLRVDRKSNYSTTRIDARVHVRKSPKGTFWIAPGTTKNNVGGLLRFLKSFSCDEDAVLLISSGMGTTSHDFAVKLEGDLFGYLGTLNVTSVTTHAVAPESGTYGTQLCLDSTTLPGAVSMASNTVLSTVAADSTVKIGTLTLQNGSWISVIGKDATIEVTDALTVEGTVAVRIGYTQARPTETFELPILKSPTALNLANFRLLLGNNAKTLSHAQLVLSDDGKTLLVRREKRGFSVLVK